MRILVVDDDQIDRMVTRRVLTCDSQYREIFEVESVQQALDVINRETFDIILLDYRMPEADGIELLIELRSRDELGGTAIVIVSASEETDLAINCIEAGAQDFISKSDLNPTVLSKAIVHAHKRFELDKKMHNSYLETKRLAERDPLTGLSNRYHFDETLKVMITNNKRMSASVALLAIDLDNFKHVNDTLGHAAGDELLVQVVNRINDCLRTNEGFARLGGDEFAIVLGSISSSMDVSSIGTRILEQFKQPFSITNTEVYTSASIGAALVPADALDSANLQKCADIAMYRAKQSGKNKLCFYEQKFQDEFNQNFVIQTALRSLKFSNYFTLVYQPIYELATQSISGFEALIRWPKDQGAHYSPDIFIPVAEQVGMIDKIGTWVIHTAIKQLSTWHKTLDSSFNISINISPIQLINSNLLEILKNESDKYGVAPNRIILEITETALVKNAKKVNSTLRALSDAGFLIALDDFGTGFSSISHLIEYPINIVKLDKSMQDHHSIQSKKYKILKGLGKMLNELDFTVVAEGIEEAQQLEVCKGLPIDRVQGYYFSIPLPATDIETFFESV